MLETSLGSNAWIGVALAIALGAAAIVALTVATRRAPVLHGIPWKWVTRGIAWIRRRFYTRDWPTHPDSVTVVGDAVALEHWLRAYEGFEGADYLSYHYEGETLNLRRPWGLDDAGRQLELHVRARDLDGGRLELLGHVEQSRYEHPDGHVHDDGLDWERGHDAMLDVLSAQSAPVRVIHRD